MFISSFIINKSDGINFAKLSGDKNVIHINELSGYNSIYGHNIVHGVLVILKFLKQIKSKIKYSSIKIQFQKGFKYDSNIKIKIIKKNKSKIIYNLLQQENISAVIEIDFIASKYQVKDFEKLSFKKNYYISEKIKKKFNSSFIPIELKIALYYLSRYVGMVYPGKNSLIHEINIFENSLIPSNKISIISSLMTKGFPIINNILKYKNYIIEFKTLFRPSLEIKFKNPEKKILNHINSFKNNILIIGASSGIGNDLLRLFLINKRIKIIATHNKNKILKKGKNLIIKKINVESDLTKILNIIKKYHPLTIYYFATPKILTRSDIDDNLINLYKKYFINVPMKIIKYANNYSSNFFYPSTIYTNILSPYHLSAYSLIKLRAEKEMNKLKKLKTKINIVKIPEINTKQNLSLIKRKLPNFRDIMASDDNLLKKIFFKD